MLETQIVKKKRSQSVSLPASIASSIQTQPSFALSQEESESMACRLANALSPEEQQGMTLKALFADPAQDNHQPNSLSECSNNPSDVTQDDMAALLDRFLSKHADSLISVSDKPVEAKTKRDDDYHGRGFLAINKKQRQRRDRCRTKNKLAWHQEYYQLHSIDQRQSAIHNEMAYFYGVITKHLECESDSTPTFCVMDDLYDQAFDSFDHFHGEKFEALLEMYDLVERENHAISFEESLEFLKNARHIRAYLANSWE